MNVSEIFYSLQGEGASVGRPSVFLRLAGCNLNCKWCDTKYARKGKKLSIEEVFKKIEKYKPRRLVITGGEPLLQEGEIVALLKRFWGTEIEIETNGTIAPTRLESSDIGLFVTYNVSPKLANSGNPGVSYSQTIRMFPKSRTIFKFVVAHKRDVSQAMEFVKVFGLPKERVYLIPEAHTRAEFLMRSPDIARLALKHKVNFSPRLHIMLWDKRRGV